MFLDELKKGEWAEVIDVCDECTSVKLIEMGCLPGELVCIKLIAPFKDPIAIEIAGNLISIRKSDAKSIRVKRLIA